MKPCTVPSFARLVARSLTRRYAHAAPRRKRSSLATIAISAVVALGVLGPAAMPASAAFQYQNDENGANDQPGQKDLTRHGVDSSGLPNSVGVSWNWDITSLSGGNTGDACSLFDTDSDARVNFAVCVTIEGNPAVQSSLSPRLYTCGDDKVDRCTQPVGQITSFTTTCGVAQTATDPFAAGDSAPVDTTALCNVQLADVGGTDAKLINTCSYPSEAPNSDPSDCVLIPRDGFLKIVKSATPDDPSVPFNFYLDGGANPVFTSNGSGTSSTIGVRTDNNPHTLSETFPAGWQQDSATCDDGSAVTALNVSSDETVTCTFNNSLALGTLIVKKAVTNDNDGTLGASDFTLHVKKSGSDVSGSPAAGSTSGTSYSLLGGSYAVSENTPSAGYTQTGFSGDCDSSGNVTVVAGQTKTCTITNDDVAPKLHLRKLVTKDNGGTASATDWTLNADGTGSNDLSGTTPVDSTSSLKADTFTLSESGGPSGYSPSDWSCSGGTQGTGADKDKITVGIGEESTCTITNDDVAPTLHLRKLVTTDNGGTASETDWTLNADGAGSNDLSGTTPVDSTSSLKADTFTLSESGGPSGYSASDWDCQGGTQGTGADKDKVTLALGDEATCTITNDDVAPTLHLRKLVTTDNGGTASATDWTLNANGDGSNDLSGSTPVDSTSSLKADTFTLSETNGPSGYSASDWDCQGGTQGAGVDKDKVTLALGDEATCTITNDDVAPTLTVIKHVVTDNGGTATAGDFTMHIKLGGSDVSGKSPFAGAEAPGTSRTLTAGSYNVSETGGPSGYSASVSGDCSSSGDVSLAVGENKTCTITNDDVAPTLTVIKHVVTDNGGTATAGDFTMHIKQSGSDVSGKSPFAGAEAPGTSRTLNAGTFVVSESDGPSGYSSSISGDCAASGSVTLAVGQDKTCTITNDDVAPKLHLRKLVTTDNGGTASEADWTLNADGAGSNDLSGTTPVDSSAGLKADTFTLSESGGPSGYAPSDWSCSGGTQGTGADKDKITVGIGQESTCTITNDDVAPTLTVIKHVVTDNGGTATAGDFTMHIEQSGSDVSGKSPFAGAEAPGTSRTLNAGTFVVSESDGPSGYSSSISGDCAASGSVTLAVGQDKTCTITNDDIAPTLTVIKHVTNDDGGTATASQYTMHIKQSGTDVSGKSPFAGAESPGAQRTLTAGSFNVSESAGPAGYAASVSGDCSSSGDVTLAVGQNKTCTITNDDIAPTLTVIKHVTNDDGGTATASQFSMHIKKSGTDVSGKSPFAGDESGTQRSLSAGSFNVSETGGPSGYAASVSSDCATNGDVTLALAQNKTCTITNDDIAPKLTVIKHIVNDNGGSATASQFSMHVKQGGTDVSGKSPFAGSESGVQRTLSAGSYTVSESDGPTGYAASISGACTASGAVSLAPGDVKTCTITNNDFAITTSLTATTGVTGAKITVAQGTTVSDVATLVGAPANAGGTVTYKVFTNSSCTTLLQTAGTRNVGAGNVADASDQLTFGQLGTYYWMAYYDGASSQKSKCGDEVVTVGTPSAPLTPGYWKNHKPETTKLLPVSLGTYVVDTFAKATAVFDNMNCSISTDNGAIGCLAGHLLATKLNVKNLSGPCILPVVQKTDAFLKGQSVTYAGITATGINYTGPAGNYPLTSAQRNLAIALKSAMDKYNNGGGC